MSITQYALFCTISLFQVGSPGPSTVFVVNNAVTRGWLRAVLILTGDLLAIGVLAVLSLLGVDAVLMANPHVFAALKLGGAVYLIWLGVNQWRGSNRTLDAARRPSDAAESLGALWTKSFLIGISNPKAILFFSSLLPQFIDRAHAGTPMLLELVALFVLIKLLVLGSYAGAATRASRWLQGDGNARLGKRLTATVLVGFGSLIAVSAFR